MSETKKPRKKVAASPDSPEPEVITTFKGFDKDLTCRGFKYEVGARRISSHVGRHEGAVQWFLYRTGLRAPSYGNSRTHVRRNGRVVKPWSPEEDNLITQLRIDGVAIRDIAAQVTATSGHPRSISTTRNRLVMLAARDEAA